MVLNVRGAKVDVFRALVAAVSMISLVLLFCSRSLRTALSSTSISVKAEKNDVAFRETVNVEKGETRLSSVVNGTTGEKITTPRSVTLCLRRKYFFGRTSNRMLTIARGLKMARDIHSKKHGRFVDAASGVAKLLLMGKKWINFYHQILDPHPDIIISKEEKEISKFICENVVDDEKAYSYRSDLTREMRELLPRKDLRERALAVLGEHYHIPIPNEKSSKPLDLLQLKSPLPFVSVHRRWLEGGCYGRANRTSTESSIATSCTARVLRDICDLSYSSLPHLAPEVVARQREHEKDIQWNKTTILFTDEQVPAKDATFPILYNRSFSLCRATDWGCSGSLMMQEICIMMLSEYHVGNPMSTVDVLVHEWRKVLPWWQGVFAQGNQSDANRGKELRPGMTTGVLPRACFN